MAENDAAGNKKRLKQIVGILHAHNVIKGLTPQKLRMIFEDLGPTFVKFGQIMSMRSDMLPPEYCKELSRLRTDVQPLPFETVASEIEKMYGKPLNEVFAEFDHEPLGSASIAQVHRAKLKSGDKVVVKIKRPGIYGVMARDVSLLRKVSGLLKIIGKTGSAIDFNLVIDEMWTAARQEMDFLNEAKQAEEFRRLNSQVAYATSPRVYGEYSTSSVFVMEYIDGIQIDDTENLEREGYDCDEIGLKLAENYAKQVIDDGFFHADPHPGNLRVRSGKIVWLDMGMMGRLSLRDRNILQNAIYAAIYKDINELEDLLLAFCGHSGHVDHSQLYVDIGDMLDRYSSLEIGNINIIKVRDDIMAVANRNGLTMPPGISMLGRGLVTIEGVVGKISPEINIMQILVNYVSGKRLKELDLSKELKNVGVSLLRSGRRVPNIPSQISELLKMGIKGQTKTNAEISGSKKLIESLEGMTDKIALSLIEAALLAGSALLCTSNSLQKGFLGIPPLSVIGFILSASLGIYLMWIIFSRKK